MSDWQKMLKGKYFNPQEIEALSEPSIMDEYIKQNYPEQWDKMVRAKQFKFAMDTAMNPNIGSIKTAPKLSKPILSTHERINSAKEVLADMVDDVDNLSARQLEDALEKEYVGGKKQFLYDYRKDYGPQTYVDYLKMFHKATNPKDKQSIQTMIDRLKAEGIHLKND